MATWPSTALIQLKDFGIEPESALTRTDMETGPAKQTQTKSRVMVTVPVMVLFRSMADYTSFLAWFKTTLHYGRDWFDWTHPVLGTIQARIPGGKLGKAVPVGSTQRWEMPTSLEYWDA